MTFNLSSGAVHVRETKREKQRNFPFPHTQTTTRYSTNVQYWKSSGEVAVARQQ